MQFPAEHASSMQPQCSRSAEAQPNMQIGTPCGRRSSRAMIHAAPFMGGWLARLPVGSSAIRADQTQQTVRT